MSLILAVRVIYAIYFLFLYQEREHPLSWGKKHLSIQKIKDCIISNELILGCYYNMDLL